MGSLPVCTPETVELEIAAQQRKVSKSGRDLQGVDLRGINFRGLDFRACNFEKANLAGAKLDGCDLRETNMKCAILSTGFLPPTTGDGDNCYKCWVNFDKGTNGQKATTVVSVESALLAGVNLSGAFLQGVDMSRVEGGGNKDIDSSVFDPQRVLLVGAHLQDAILE